jgi:hypothetical protein
VAESGGAPIELQEEVLERHLRVARESRVGKNVWVKPGQPSSTYLEVEGSSESANAAIQLWDASTEGKRNTLIVEMTGHTNQKREHFWASNNEALVGKAAVTLFLMKNGLATRAQLQRQSDDAQRRTLIAANQKHTKKSANELNKMSNRQLVLLGFTWAK